MDDRRLKSHVLVVEDEKAIAAFVQAALEREGLAVRVARSGEAALTQIEAERPDLILLDLMLPGLDGFEVCRRVRAQKPYIPIIMLTARAEDTDKIVGLELGADDYITKPFNVRELAARVRALLRLLRQASGGASTHFFRAGDLTVDRDRHVTAIGGRPIDLTPKEFDLLATLVAERGRVFGREMLLERVWGYDYMGESRTVDVHIQRLRQKIEADPANPRYLLTVRGLGYKFAAEEDL